MTQKDTAGNMAIYNALRTPPDNALKPFNNGKMSGTDTNPMWRIKAMTEMFGPCGEGWYFEIAEHWTDTVPKIKNGQTVNEHMAFVIVNLYIKLESGEWSRPIVGLGGNSLSMQMDEGFKGALTDALSIAMKNLGMCADIWFGADRTSKYAAYYNDAPKADTDDPAPAPAQKATAVPQTEAEAVLMAKNAKSAAELIALWRVCNKSYGESMPLKEAIANNPNNPKYQKK